MDTAPIGAVGLIAESAWAVAYRRGYEAGAKEQADTHKQALLRIESATAVVFADDKYKHIEASQVCRDVFRTIWQMLTEKR